MTKRITILDEYMNQVVWCGGLPIRRGDMIKQLDEVAKTWDATNWMRIRDAGLIGNTQFNEKHGYPPSDIKPYSLAEFKAIVES